MSNPFLGEVSSHTPTSISDPHGDDLWLSTTPFHVAGLLLLALVLLTAMKMSGFRAMVGIGRG